MNKKQLFIAAVAAMLSVTGANATDITGVTGSGGVFNIDPTHMNGDVGYRQYENFNLSEGDVANLIFHRGGRDLSSFINLVDNQVTINGILNTMRDGNFYDGHAIFVSPNGMVVGASGVLNVGALSVVTPTDEKYRTLKAEQAAQNYENIKDISNLLNNEANVGSITIDGKVFANNGVQLRGSNITVGSTGAILNGVTNQQAYTSNSGAESLFNSLVNTEGIKSGASFERNGSNIQIKSGEGMSIAGKVINGAADKTGITAERGNSGVFLTNSGSDGTSISGLVQSTHELNVLNKSGELNISGTVKNEGADLNISNRGADVTIGGKLSTNKNLAITNNSSTGSLALSGTATSSGNTNIVNEGSGGMNITGTVGGNATPSVRIVNRGGKLVISNTTDKVSSSGTVRVENSGSAGMEIGGIKGNDRVSVENSAGTLTVNGKVSVDDGGELHILNNGTKLDVASAGDIVGHGNLSLRNTGASGMSIGGKITNTGETAINNDAGAMTISKNINNTGNMGIINNGSGMTITNTAQIKNEGTLKVKNYGTNGMSIAGTVENTGRTYFYNDAGSMTLKTNGQITNHDGGLYLTSRENSKGIVAEANSTISNEGMYDLAIVHKGNGTASDGNGMNLQGEIVNEGTTAINNYKGNMNFTGSVDADGNLGIINREGSGSMNLAAGSTINNTGNANIKNYGNGNMTVNSEITHTGRVNVLANSGKLTLGAQVHNNSNGKLDDNNGFYAAARQNGTGIDVTSDFVADGNGQYLIKNISGANGLTFDGSITGDGSQAAVVNKVGDMTISGTINRTNAPVIISNFGGGLTTTSNSVLTSNKEVKVVNTGSQAAELNGTVNAPEGERWFYGN